MAKTTHTPLPEFETLPLFPDDDLPAQWGMSPEEAGIYRELTAGNPDHDESLRRFWALLEREFSQAKPKKGG